MSHIFPYPFSLWDDAAMSATFNNREWFWLDDHTCVFTN